MVTKNESGKRTDHQPCLVMRASGPQDSQRFMSHTTRGRIVPFFGFGFWILHFSSHNISSTNAHSLYCNFAISISLGALISHFLCCEVSRDFPNPPKNMKSGLFLVAPILVTAFNIWLATFLNHRHSSADAASVVPSQLLEYESPRRVFAERNIHSIGRQEP